MTRRCRSWLVPLTVAVGMLFVVTAGAYAAPGSESSGRMTVNTGGQFVTLASSRVTATGQLQNQVTGGAARATATAPAASTVPFGPGTVDVAPPMALAGEASAARAPRVSRGPLAHAAWTNPCDHCWYN